MASESLFYITSKGVVPPPADPPDRPKPRSLSDDVYDYQSFAEEASASSAQFATRSQEWSAQVDKWTIQRPDSPFRQRTGEFALAAFRSLEKSKTRAEDRRDALSSR